MKTCKLCPIHRNCWGRGECKDCAFGKAFEGLDNKIKKLKGKNEALQNENEELKEVIECFKNPNF